jgi:hypothetical protein
MILDTHLSMRAVKLAARAAGFGYSYPKLVRDEATMALYLSKYVAKPCFGPQLWPKRTRWTQTVLPRLPRSKEWIVRLARLAGRR